MSMLGAKYIVAIREKENRKSQVAFLTISGKSISEISKKLNMSEEDVNLIIQKIKNENSDVYKAMRL